LSPIKSVIRQDGAHSVQKNAKQTFFETKHIYICSPSTGKAVFRIYNSSEDKRINTQRFS